MDAEETDAFYDEAPAAEVEETEDEVVDRASAARTIAELEAEIQTLALLGQSLGGAVFDVLGKCFTEKPLRELLVEAIRYGDRP
jgi:hypothetical protein